MNTQKKQLPPECERARDAKGLALADGVAAPAEAIAHAEGCDDCAKTFRRMDKVWAVAGEAIPKLATDKTRLDAIVIAARRDADIEQQPAKIIPLRRERPAPATSGLTITLALAATVAAIAFLGPKFIGVTATPTPVALVPTAVPPAGPVRISLAKAFGDVSFVPADGSVVRAPVAGDPLPPGLFSATKGAALSVEGEGLLAVRGDATILIGGESKAPDLSVARGEIFVDLPKGTIKTFIVHTPTGSVNVTGTEFTVKVEPKATKVEVTRGSVLVKGANGSRSIAAGEAASLGVDGPPVSIAASDPTADPLSWVRDLAPDRAPAAPVLAIKSRPRNPVATVTGDHVEVEMRPGLDKDVIEMAMKKREAAMRHCYEMEMVKNNSLVVRATLTFKVDELGAPEDLLITGLAPEYAPLKSCLLDAASKAVFPSPVAGTVVDVIYPIRFEPVR